MKNKTKKAQEYSTFLDYNVKIWYLLYRTQLKNLKYKYEKDI